MTQQIVHSISPKKKYVVMVEPSFIKEAFLNCYKIHLLSIVALMDKYLKYLSLLGESFKSSIEQEYNSINTY